MKEREREKHLCLCEFWFKPPSSHRSLLSVLSHVYTVQPLPRFLANGRVLFFNVTCQTESAQVLKDHGSCRDLRSANTSCSLRLPAGRCSCALTASTSAGTSPEAHIWHRGASERGRVSLKVLHGWWHEGAVMDALLHHRERCLRASVCVK